MNILKQECETIYNSVILLNDSSTKITVDFSNENWEQLFINFLDYNDRWTYISMYQKLSEKFIEKYFDRLNTDYISAYQKLSEKFIEKYFNRLNTDCISRDQKLSEKFIEKYFNRLNKYRISAYQKLSEKFIEKYFNRLNTDCISKYQKLSEKFIEKYFDRLNTDYISAYQKLSEKFIKDHNIEVLNSCWLYKSTDFIRNYIKEKTNYTIETDSKGDYIIAYKGIKSDRHSKFNFSYRYLKGKSYSSHCDCNIDNENSFGLSAWTEELARDYCNELVVRVKIYLEDIGCFVHENGKIRCRKLTVLD